MLLIRRWVLVPAHDFRFGKNPFARMTAEQRVEAFKNLMEAHKAAEIKSGRAPGKKQISREVSIGKRGSLIVPKNLVSELGFQEGDSFTVKKSRTGISLSKN